MLGWSRVDGIPPNRRSSTARVRRALGIGALLLTSLAASQTFVQVASASASSGTTPYVPPQLTNPAVQNATLDVALRYANAVPGLDARNLRWFLYAIEHRESTFNTNLCNYNDGAANWNNPPSDPSFWPTTDHIPHGCGVAQTTGWTHEGMPWPNFAKSSPASLNKGVYGTITPPRAVTALTTPFDPDQELARFVTEHVLPDYIGIHRTYPSYNVAQILRAVAFHWNKGDWIAYDPANCDYLCLYDQYVAQYEPAVMNDPAWPPAAAPPAPSFALTPNESNWHVETNATTTQGNVTSVSATINGANSVNLTQVSGTVWARDVFVPAGATVRFSATTSAGANGSSANYTWPSPTLSIASTANETNWHLEATANASYGNITRVYATATGLGPWALSPAGAGLWTASAFVPGNVSVSFTAVSNTGARATSAPFTSPSPTVSFHTTSRETNGFVEANVTPSYGDIQAVQASVNGASPVALSREAGTLWSANTFVPAGAAVRFAATTTAATNATSGAFLWPSPSVAFALTGNETNHRIEVNVSTSYGTIASVSASVNGGSPQALAPAGADVWGTNALVPAQASVVFTAATSAQSFAQSTAYTWVTPAVSFALTPNESNTRVEVRAQASGATVVAVALLLNGSPAGNLSLETSGNWGLFVPIAAGARVSFDARTDAGSQASSGTYTWAAPTVQFAASPNVNNWWVEVSATASSGSVTSVSAIVNGGTPVALTADSWGTWARSMAVPGGASVVFVATTSAHSTARSAPILWPAPHVAFSLSPNVNRWWVEVSASVPSGTTSIAGVSASVNGGAPVALSRTSWGTWAKSFYVASGSSVVFLATTTDGSVVRSAPLTWK
jgi:hypothetical protein